MVAIAVIDVGFSAFLSYIRDTTSRSLQQRQLVKLTFESHQNHRHIAEKLTAAADRIKLPIITDTKKRYNNKNKHAKLQNH